MDVKRFPMLKMANCLLLVAVATVLLYNASLSAEHHTVNKKESSAGRERKRRSTNENVTLPPSGGATYIRWGRTQCPENDVTELVYAGVVGGQWFDNTGGGSNYICLPLDPLWGTYNALADTRATIHGGEYQFAKSFPFNSGPIANLEQHNAPCAVCRVSTRSSAFMLPARNQCYAGWTLEYWGYLATSHYGHKGRTEYICVDEQPEADESGYRDENGALLYSVEGRCGSLPCPPYAEGRELTCAVCTK